jgi:methyl-accepting chemotaxis protein
MPLKEIVAMVYDGGKRVADVLPSPESSEVDLEHLKEEIRQEVASLRSSGRQVFPDGSSNARPPAVARLGAFDASSVRPMIDLADSFADIAANLPPVHRFRGVVRRLARLTARLILTVSRFITDRQRAFNQLTTRSLSVLADGLEHSTAGLAEQVRALEDSSKRQAERISSLEAALKSRTEQVDREGSGNGPARPEA